MKLVVAMPVICFSSVRLPRSCCGCSAVGGPIALIEEGDLIQINIPERSLSIVGIAGKEMEPAEVDAVLAERRAAWKPKANRYTSGTLKFFTEHAVSAIQGGYME